MPPPRPPLPNKSRHTVPLPSPLHTRRRLLFSFVFATIVIGLMTYTLSCEKVLTTVKLLDVRVFWGRQEALALFEEVSDSERVGWGECLALLSRRATLSPPLARFADDID